MSAHHRPRVNDLPNGGLKVLLCECGCGNPAPIATHTDARFGVKKGQPRRFIFAHNNTPGAQSIHWKGGRTKHGDGYILIHRPEHPRQNGNGYVPEHVLIAEKALGRPLPPGVQVHHVNEDREDNRNENLVICENQAYHALLHQRMRAVKAGVPANWLKCKYCKRYDAPDQLYLHTTGNHGHHVACASLYTKVRRDARKGLHP